LAFAAIEETRGPAMAAKLILGVFRGGADAPPGFLVEVDTEFVEALLANIDIARTSQNPFRTIDVQDVLVTKSIQRLLIEGRAA
jgi:hypothetical protein